MKRQFQVPFKFEYYVTSGAGINIVGGGGAEYYDNVKMRSGFKKSIT